MAKTKKPLIVDAPDDELSGGSRGRSFWSGTISFGLVSVPVEMFSAQRSERVSLRTLASDGTPLSRRYYRADNGKEVESIERGFALDDGQLVPLSEEELTRLAPEKSRDIDLRAFMDASAIDARYLDRAYFLLPAGKNTLAYRLLVAAMERAGKVGVATFVMRAKEYLIAIEAESGILRAQTLRFSDELRTAEDVGLSGHGKPDAELVRKFKKEMTRLKKRDVALSELDDPYATKLAQLVEKKRKHHQGVIAPKLVEADEAGGAEVIDLLSVLRESLRKDKQGPGTSGRTAQKRAKGQRKAAP